MRGRKRAVIGIAGFAVLMLVAGLFYLKAPSAVAPTRPATFQVDGVVVEKAKRTLTLYHGDKAVKSYPVSLGGDPIGHKRQQGDQRTPEGHYVLDWRNPNSKFHLSLHISYPNKAHRAAAAKRGVAPGGDIMVHGLPNGLGALAGQFLKHDWTDG